MRSRPHLLATVPAAALVLALSGAPALAQVGGETAGSAYAVETVAEGLEHPWGHAFVPDTSYLLVSERAGRLQLLDRESGEMTEVSGVPEVHAVDQGGLLDLALHPRFPDEPWLYMTWAGADDEGRSATHLGRARLDLDERALSDVEVLHVFGPFFDSDAHFGSRIVFDTDETLVVTVGDRNFKDFGPDHVAQDTTNYVGGAFRFTLDGAIPDDNPFLDDDGVNDAYFVYGLRNTQAMAIHPDTGEIWVADHGENNGDEINILEPGGNFGWPIATYGVDYQTSEAIGATPGEVPETIDPIFAWGPDHPEGFPPSGFAFYDGDAFPEWRGNALIGNLWHRYLGRFSVDGRSIEPTERLLDGEDWRIRDVGVAPDNGHVYVFVDDEDAPIVRLVPADG